MRITYDTLLSLTINHLYFTDKVFEGFELTPDETTKVFIRDARLVEKKKGNTWSLYFQAEGPFGTDLASLTNKEFLFYLKITDPFFYAITDDAYLHAQDETFLFTSPLNAEMVPEKRGVHSLKFDYHIHHSVRPVSIKVTPFNASNPLINEVVVEPAVLVKNLDLAPFGGSLYDIAEDTVPTGSPVLDKVFVSEVSNREAFYGAVYFKVLAAAASNQYKLNFINS